MNQAGPVKCSRCRQPLPRGTTFCVGCGIQNQPDQVMKQVLENEKVLESGVRRSRMFRWLASWFTGRRY